MTPSKQKASSRYDRVVYLLVVPVALVLTYSFYWLYMQFADPPMVKALFDKNDFVLTFNFAHTIPEVAKVLFEAVRFALTESVKTEGGFDMLWIFYKPLIWIYLILIGLGTLVFAAAFASIYLTNRFDSKDSANSMSVLIKAGFGLLVAPAYCLAALFCGSKPECTGRESMGFLVVVALAISTYMLGDLHQSRADPDLEDQPFLVKIKGTEKLAKFAPLKDISSIEDIEKYIDSYEVYANYSSELGRKILRVGDDRSERFKQLGLPPISNIDLKEIVDLYKNGSGVQTSTFPKAFSVNFQNGEVMAPKGSQIFFQSAEFDPWATDEVVKIVVGVYKTVLLEKPKRVPRDMQCKFSGSFSYVLSQRVTRELNKVLSLINDSKQISAERKTELKGKVVDYFGERVYFHFGRNWSRFTATGWGDGCKKTPMFVGTDVMLSRLDRPLFSPVYFGSSW